MNGEWRSQHLIPDTRGCGPALVILTWKRIGGRPVGWRWEGGRPEVVNLAVAPGPHGEVAITPDLLRKVERIIVQAQREWGKA